MKNWKLHDQKTLVFVGPSDSQALIHWKTKLRSAGDSRWSTKTGSGGYRKTVVIIDTFEGMYGFPVEIERWTVNLYNNNIYKNIKYSTPTHARTPPVEFSR